MPRNPTGTNYAVPNTFAPLTKAYSAQANQNFQDIGQELVNSLTADGRRSWSGNQDANGHKVTGLLDGTSNSDAATVGQAAWQIGDYKDTVRPLDSKWLRRNGGLQTASTYPDLATMFPSLPAGLYWSAAANPSITLPGVRHLRKMSNGNVAALYRSGAALSLQISDDFQNFSSQVTVSTIAQSRADYIEYGNGVHVILVGQADSGGTKVSRGYYSEDGGVTWQESTYPNDAPSCGLIYFAGLFISFAPKNQCFYTSPDGRSWTQRVLAGFDATPDLQPEDSTMAVLNGVLYALNPGAFYKSASTEDGVTFNVTSSTTPSSRSGLTTDGIQLIGYGSGGNIEVAPSLDGPWVKKTSGVLGSIRSIWHSDGVYVAVGGGFTLISDNIDTWITTGAGDGATTLVGDPHDSGRFISNSINSSISEGEVTTSTSFRLPNDNPGTGWIKAL